MNFWKIAEKHTFVGPPIMKNEIPVAKRKMKSGKATGSYSISLISGTFRST